MPFRTPLRPFLFSCLITATLGGLSSPAASAAGVPYLLKDIEPRLEPRVRPVSELVPFGGLNYFWGTDATTGTELWKTDGTDAGTVRVKDLAQGRDSSYYTVAGIPSGLIPFGDSLYFVAIGNGQGWQVWKTDGTDAGTVALTNLPADSTWISQLTRVGGEFFFLNENEFQGGLWKTDGTVEGTVRLAAGRFTHLFAQGGRVIARKEGYPQEELWGSDGTVAGTVLLKAYPSYSNPVRMSAGTDFYFVAGSGSGNELWKTDGTVAGTARVSTQADRVLGELDGWMYFTFYHGLYRTQGSPADIEYVAPLPEAPYIHVARAAGGQLFFSWTNGTGDVALWRTDGTEDGTLVVRNVTMTEPPVAFGSELFFNAYDAGTGSVLWKSDGTPEGTVPVKPATSVEGSPPFPGVEAQCLGVSGGTLYFTGAEHPASGIPEDATYGLWKSDGTAAGTTPVDLPGGGRGISVMPPFFGAGQLAYFQVYGPQNELNLWQTDGTPEGTRKTPVTEIPAQVWGVVEMNGARYYVHSDSFGENSLSKTEDAGGDPVLLKQVTGSIDHLTRLGDTLYFTVQDPYSSIYSLWKTDGTPEGTVLVKGPDPEIPPIYSMEPIGSAGGMLFYLTRTNYNLNQIWKTDGTPEGTIAVASISLPQPAYVTISWTEVLGDIVCFGVTDRERGTVVWRTDGTVAGTYPIRDFTQGSVTGVAYDAVRAGGAAYFELFTPDGAYELWKTDGTTAGTVKVSSLVPYLWSRELTGAGDLIFFSSQAGGTGLELWRSDGTEAGTFRVKDIRPGAGSGVYGLKEHRGLVFFCANDGIHGDELWRSDGTEAGTFMVGDITGDGGGGFIGELTPAGHRLVFLGATTATGREPFVYDPSEAPAITALAPVTITPHGAILRGTVNAGGIPVTATLEYGTSTAYGTSATIPLVENNLLIPRAFTLPLAGLAPGTTYHYRYTAVNDLGQVQTTDGTFTTQAATPLNVWLELHDAPGGAGGDKDKDGLKNVLEFAFGTDPADAQISALVETGGVLVSRGLPVVRGDGAAFRGLFVRRKDSADSQLVYTPQFSADLVEWIDATTTPQLLGGTELYQLLSYPGPVIPDGPELRFFRVKVAAP